MSIRTIRCIRSNHTASAAAQLGLQKGESVIEVDGNTTTPVLQHVGLSAWPGRLTLTDHAVYFEVSNQTLDPAATNGNLQERRAIEKRKDYSNVDFCCPLLSSIRMDGGGECCPLSKSEGQSLRLRVFHWNND